MEENFSTIFEEALSHKTSSIISLQPHVKISNPYTQQEYLLTHKYKKSPNTFLCTDLSKNEHHLKIIPCASYSDIKKASKNLSYIQGVCQSNALLETFDSFEVLDKGKWYFLIVTPTMKAVSLSQLAESALRLRKVVPKHNSIGILITLIDIIEDVYSRNTELFCIYPNSILVCMFKVGPTLFDLNGQSFSLKISAASPKLLTLNNIRAIRDEKEDLFKAALAIYKIIGKDDLTGVQTRQTLQFFSLKFQDAALEEIFKLLIAEDCSVFKHSFLKIWKGCIRNEIKNVEQAEVKDLHVLNSILMFTDFTMKTMAIKQMLILGKTFHDVYVYLNVNNLFWVFIEECLKIKWSEDKNLLEAFFRLLKLKPKDFAYREKLCELGILGLIYATTEIDPHSEDFLGFIKDFTGGNTLTVMQILFDTGVVAKTLDLCKKFPQFKVFINDTMPYYGHHSPKLIEEIFTLEIFPALIILQSLLEIPFYFKLEKLEQVLNLILVILKKKKYQKDEHFEIIKCVIQILTEILNLPFLIQKSLQNFECTSHTEQEMICLTKNPFLYYCDDCSIPLCSVCLNCFHSDHSFHNLLYMTGHFKCNCEENHESPNAIIEDFSFPYYKTRYTFLPSPGTTMVESTSNIFSCKNEMTITTQEALVTEWSHMSPGIIFYYEVKIHKAGNLENVMIGIVGADITYSGINGHICVGGRVVCKGPRYGSYDTVGIGIFRTQRAFFTYNGLLCNKFIDIEANQELKIHITLCGNGCEVEVKLRKFLFQSFKPGNSVLNSTQKTQIDEIFNLLTKGCKKGNDPRLIEARFYLKSLLLSAGKEKIAKKLT